MKVKGVIILPLTMGRNLKEIERMNIKTNKTKPIKMYQNKDNL
jgi:hypothetical protein